MKKNINVLGSSLIAMGFLSIALAYAVSPTKVNMGNTDNFAILAGSAITNIGSSVINGDLGIYPGTAVTGFPPAVLNGTQHINDTQAINAKSGLTSVYLDASSRTPVSTIPTEQIGRAHV